MDAFDSRRMAAFEVAIIAAEQASGRHFSALPGEALSLHEQDWLAGGHFFNFSDEASTHPDPIVADLAHLQNVQVTGSTEGLISCVESLFENLQQAELCQLQTIGCSSLLSVSRIALRTGAWKLLARTLPAGLALARNCPQRRRLSVATGLVAEWALAAGHSRLACIYATESLRHGSENQRIQGYLGFAYALASQWDYTFLLLGNALAVQNSQSNTRDRRAFGASNLVRAYAIRAIMTSSYEDLEEAERRFRDWHSVMHSNPSSMPASTALVALNVGKVAHGQPPDEIMELVLDDILKHGRWRDLLALERLLPIPCPLEPKQRAAIAHLNTLKVDGLPAVSLVDEAISELPMFVPQEHNFATEKRPLALFCI